MSVVPRPPAFVHDLETCVGCHACVVACANENELAPGTSWRHVVSFNAARRPGVPVFHLSLACNHCLDAPCLRQCPARAITRDATTGAVLIDDRACIGCRYCSWVCPYDAPRFDGLAGVMRKCTLCSHRLAEGLTPACVSLCPVGALSLDAGGLNGAVHPAVAGFPETGIRPSIKFLPLRRRGEVSGQWAVDSGQCEPLESDTPLPKVSLRSEWTLAAFTSVAIVLTGALLGWMIGGPRPVPVAFAVTGAIAAIISTLHLGKPARAWRAALNVRTSWLSREIVTYSAFLALGTTALALDPPGGSLAWAATVAAALCLVSIDGVYVAMARLDRTWFDDRSALFSALFLAGVFSGQAVLWVPAGVLRALGFSLRVWRHGAPGGAATVAARALLGWVLPLGLWAGGGHPALAAVATIAGEVIDRASFYQSLSVITPGAQMARDEVNWSAF